MTILSKQYPMDLGTGSIEQVRQSAPKIDMELGAIYGHLNNIRTRYRSATAPTNPEAGQVWEDTVNNKIMKWNGSAWVEDIAKSVNLTNRNTVLQGQVSSAGALELILGSASTLTADLVSSAIETVIAIPAGHDATAGNLDYIVSFTATQTDFWTSLPATNTSYLFVDYSGGTVTGVYSVIAPVYQSYAPAHSAGLNWFDTNKEQWYLSDGSAWTAVYRCYVGYVVTDGTKVTATTIEPYNRIRANIIGTASLDVPLSYLDTDGALAANSDSKIATQKAVKTYVDANAGGGASIGTGNYIAEPFAVTPGTGLEVSVAANRCVIDETVCESTTATTVALTAKAAQLIYKKKDNTYDKLLPKMSAADLVDANTVGLWITDGSANVPNAAVGVNGNTLAVANDLIRSGTVTAVDGWAGGNAAKGDGSTGYYTSANSTGFPTQDAVRSMGMFFTYNGATATNQNIGTVGNINIVIGADSILYFVNSEGSTYSSDYRFEIGKPYFIENRCDGATQHFAVNGQIVTGGINDYNVVPNVLTVMRHTTAGWYSTITLHFVEIRNALRTPAQIAQVAQKLLIPCAHKGSTPIAITDANLITSGDYSGHPKYYAIDGNNSTCWVSSTGCTIDSTYIGCKGLTKDTSVSNIQIFTASTVVNNITIVKPQYSVDGGSTWQTIAILSGLQNTASTLVGIDIPSYLANGNHWFRLLAGETLAGGANWFVGEIIFNTAKTQTDIRTPNLPADTAVLAHVVASSTAPIKIVDASNPSGATPDWAYGIRVGPNGILNRIKRLGKQCFSGTMTKKWDDPFGSRNIIMRGTWSLDAAGTLESQIPEDAANSYLSVDTSGKIVQTVTTGVNVAGSNKTTGYLDVVAEVID